MKHHHTILSEIKGRVATLCLNRPDVYNAMDIEMIRGLTKLVLELSENNNIRIVALSSTGKHFSAGADLKWMREGMKQAPEQLEAESMELAGLFRSISESEKIFVSAIRGKVLGGANGLVAASDIAIAEESSSFAFTEVKLGMLPATIAPFVLRKIGYSRTSELMISGRTFDAREAKEYALIHHVCKNNSLQEATEQVLEELLSNGPEAMLEIKRMLPGLSANLTAEQVQKHTAKIIARRRISSEGQEGMNAFFEKRKPYWNESQ